MTHNLKSIPDRDVSHEFRVITNKASKFGSALQLHVSDREAVILAEIDNNY